MSSQNHVKSVARKSDMSDEPWAIIGPMPVLPEGGRPRTTDMRKALNGMFYQLRSGCTRRDLPHALF